MIHNNSKNRLGNYLSLVKFSHTIFALPFALIGYFLAIGWAGYSFSWFTFVPVLLCMIFARTAAMAFNRYVDRIIDGRNPRTALREIPAGIIHPDAALRLVYVCVLLFIITTLFINKLVFFLSPLALIIVLGYSFTKKFTSFSHFILGLGLSLAPIGAFLAVTGSFRLLPILYSGIVLFWVAGFDILYALQDEDFDKNEKLFSVPVKFGRKGALAISSIVHLLAGVLVMLAGYSGHMGVWYWIGAFLFLAMLVYQHIILSVEDLSRLNLAFFTTNGIASVVFAAFAIADMLL